jgi:hypothetical protein
MHLKLDFLKAHASVGQIYHLVACYVFFKILQDDSVHDDVHVLFFGSGENGYVHVRSPSFEFAPIYTLNFGGLIW